MSQVSTSVQILREHYQTLLETYGDSLESGQWGSKEGLLARYAQLVKIGDLNGCRLLDIGCNLGNFAAYLQEQNINCKYSGVDIVPEAIEIARHKFPTMQFDCLDITQERPSYTYDYVFASAVLNNSLPDSKVFLETLIQKAFSCCERGLAFNFISSYVNFQEDLMAYHEPEAVLNFCIKNLSRKVILFHHYYHCDVCIYVYK
ncbi:class I SAM-dependent methyltransferase [Nostoc sp. C110]|uniref:class I SAM-dependent methyltransferase n=1 Tax=Nostoc sp. C110 TaxID=3349876 RepID=UPI00370D6229